MKILRKDQQALMFNMLVVAGMAVIILFAVLNIGTYINGTISSALVETYPTNQASGSIDAIYWNNASGNGSISYRNITLPTECTARELTGATSGCNVYNNGTEPIWFNLTTNGHTTYNVTINAGSWRNTTLTALIASGNVSNSDTYLNFSWLTNSSTNRVRMRTVGTYHKSSDYRTTIENGTVSTLEGITAGYDRTVEIIVVAAIITAITIPLAAIVAVKKLF